MTNIYMFIFLYIFSRLYYCKWFHYFFICLFFFS